MNIAKEYNMTSNACYVLERMVYLIAASPKYSELR